MAQQVEVGVVLPAGLVEGTGPRRTVELAIEAERLGYRSVWVGDTLIKPVLDPLVLLGALASATEHVTLGTAALLPALRRPVQTAQALASLDLLSGGRLVVTVGAGFPGRSEREHAVSDIPWGRRFARLDDTVALWRRLWAARPDDADADAPPISFHGDVLHYDDVPPATPPARPGGPPLWLAGIAPAALDRTGRRYDGWLPYPPDPADYATGWAEVQQAARAAGRRPEALTPALFATVVLADSVGAGRRALETFAQASYGRPVEQLETIQSLTAGPPEHVVDELGRFVAAGSRHLLLRIADLDPDHQLDQLTRLAGLADQLTARTAA